MAQDLGLEVSTFVTPALHPQNVASLEDYDDDTSGTLQQAVEAFHYAYRAVAKTHAAREAVRNDPSLTEAAQVLRTADHADREFKVAASKLDRVHMNMRSGIAMVEKELSAPVQSVAAHQISAEIRSFVRGLVAEGRSPMDFVRSAIDNGDLASASAVLGAPAYLSGLTPEAHKALLRMHHAKANPGALKKLRAMEGVVNLIHKNAPLLHGELEKAIGVDARQLKKFREAKARSDRAFAS